MIRMN